VTGSVFSDILEIVDYAAGLASTRRTTLVVAGAGDPLTLAAVRDALREGLAQAILVGREKTIREEARKLGLNPGLIEIVDCGPEDQAVVERSLDLLQHGEGELLMKGSVKTEDLLGGFLERGRGFRTGRFLSHLGVFTAPGAKRLMMITDGGLNIAPDLARKQDILLNAVDVAHVLGIECPRVAVLAHVEKSPETSLPMIRDAVELVRLNREGKLPGCVVDGPLALDNAVSPEAAARKGIGGPVAGQADILLANEIGMGNVIYKAVQSWLCAPIAGVVVGGRVPVINPSRVDSEQSKLAAIALAVVLASARTTAL
jgi:phosphate butyryltransferase